MAYIFAVQQFFLGTIGTCFIVEGCICNITFHSIYITANTHSVLRRWLTTVTWFRRIRGISKGRSRVRKEEIRHRYKSGEFSITFAKSLTYPSFHPLSSLILMIACVIGLHLQFNLDFWSNLFVYSIVL